MSLIPNIGGLGSQKEILVSVVYSPILYRSPVWHEVGDNNMKFIMKLAKLQRNLK